VVGGVTAFPGFTGVALLACAAFWLQNSISAFEGAAAQAALARVPIVRMPIAMNCEVFMCSFLFGQWRELRTRRRSYGRPPLMDQVVTLASSPACSTSSNWSRRGLSGP
jgi:hypothetical protein